MTKMESLKDKVVLITESSAGIGEATALLFSKYGCKLVITDRNDDDQKLAKVAQRCEEASPNKYNVLTVVGDIGNDEFQATLVSAVIQMYGQLDILVNNADDGTFANILSKEFRETFDNVMNINLRAPVMLTRLALPHLIKTKGCVINISSLAAFRWVIDDAMPYHLSKSALDAMTRLLAYEFGPKGVRVVSVNPGVVKTSQASVWEKASDSLVKNIPLGKLGSVDEIANVICFMASSGASFVTGTTVVVDGGQSTI